MKTTTQKKITTTKTTNSHSTPKMLSQLTKRGLSTRTGVKAAGVGIGSI